jgi:hypothetical protein
MFYKTCRFIYVDNYLHPVHVSTHHDEASGRILVELYEGDDISQVMHILKNTLRFISSEIIIDNIICTISRVAFFDQDQEVVSEYFLHLHHHSIPITHIKILYMNVLPK